VRTPQPGIFAQGTRAHYYLEFELRPDAPPDAVRGALAALREPPVTAGGSNIVIGFGPRLWRQLAPNDAPDTLRDFTPIGPVPATQGDVWIWVHGTNHDVVLDIARSAMVALAPVAELAYEQPAFVYLDSRDMTGFIDGTENPPIWEAPEVVVVEDGHPGAGGAHVLVMRWVHDLGAFHSLEEDEQEKVIGRTKPDSVELDEDVKPADAHIGRVVIEEDGEELEVYRRSTPFGSVQEQGLEFVLFTADPAIPTRMLHRMAGDEDGVTDHLTKFSRPERSAFYFVPSIQSLRDTLC
jgi:putative iron-dependent peroxidase